MTDTTKKEDPTRIILGSPEHPVRFSYAFFHEPRIDDKKIDKKTGKPEAMYTAMIMVPKADKTAKAKIEAAIRAAADVKIPGKSIPSVWSMPLRDGDEEYEDKGEHMKGYWFFNCKSKIKPDVVGTERDMDNKLCRLSKDEIKSGDYGRVAVNFYYFENESKGIAVGLGHVQKLKDGEALGTNSASADALFDDDMDAGFSD